MKIVVTGGSGFIGTELVKRLMTNHDVTVADLRIPRIGVTYKFCDVTDVLQVYDVLKGAELVYHLAANPDPSLAMKNPHWDLRINVEGTLNVAEVCRRENIKLVFTSSAAINYSPLSYYAITKKAAEGYILNNVKRGLYAIIVRLNNIYGPTQSKGFVIPDLIEKLQKNPKEVYIKGTGFELRDFVFIDDVVDALILVAEKGESGKVYEVGTGQQTTIFELARLLGRLMNGFEPVVIPEQKITSWEREEYPQYLDDMFNLGWRPKYTLEEGLKRTISERGRVVEPTSSG